jgi:hypothetical protein
MRGYQKIALALSIICSDLPVNAASLRLTSTTVAESGGTADVCVVLAADGDDVAGVQNDLSWDGSCATLDVPSACSVNPAIGKQLSGAFSNAADFTYRAIVLSLTDTAAIPDGPLYCCAMTIVAEPGRCCAIGIDNALASDSLGAALPVVSRDSEVCVAAAQLVATSAPTPTPTPGPVLSDDGCHIAAAPSTTALPMIGAGVAALLITRRRRRRARNGGEQGAARNK